MIRKKSVYIGVLRKCIYFNTAEKPPRPSAKTFYGQTRGVFLTLFKNYLWIFNLCSFVVNEHTATDVSVFASSLLWLDPLCEGDRLA